MGIMECEEMNFEGLELIMPVKLVEYNEGIRKLSMGFRGIIVGGVISLRNVRG